MMSNYNNPATDIITFIGVPLAVLGVLPILYNTLATLAALSKIKRMLRHGKLTALTRSDIINRVIEVELPRYAVQPWDRFNHRAEYWQLSRQPSLIPGGSWTTFNWKTNTIGIKTQRVEYADQLRQPQVEIEFHELVAYLLDLGAVPDAHGWRLLRSTGLWTPMGCSLMKSPDGTRVALAIAPLDDSDGHLSLKVSWEPSWTTRDESTLPPYWVRLPAAPVRKPAEENSATASTSEEVVWPEVIRQESDLSKESVPTARPSMDTIQKETQNHAERSTKGPITCQFTVDGLEWALSQDQELLYSSTHVNSLYIKHLRTQHHRMNGTWFASVATAYGTSSQTVLWNYKIPDEILAFARRDTVPCGVLEILGVVDSDKTPDWATHQNDHLTSHDNFTRRMHSQRQAMAAEAKMPPAQAQIAARERMQREAAQRMDEMRDITRRDTQRRETRRYEALQSPKWDTTLVAEHNLSWLRARKVVDSELELREVVGTLLHRMVLDGEFAKAICEMLDVWKAWSDNGGMRNTDFEKLQQQQEIFAQASLLMALVKGAVTAKEGTLSMDLQDCLRMWRIVRLG